jgi:hypothetical protein
MLGSVKHKAGWIWYDGGKHPAAKYFLEIGPRDSLLQAVADWVAGGFRQWLTQNSQNDHPRQFSWLHAMLKKRSHKAPNAVFMGGSPTKNYLMVFNRPIGRSDFSRLWAQCA